MTATDRVSTLQDENEALRELCLDLMWQLDNWALVYDRDAVEYSAYADWFVAFDRRMEALGFEGKPWRGLEQEGK